jgi:two-component system OmpR family sensor kinase
MFTSLRSRLWLTYALLAGGVLCIVAGGLIVFIIRNPSQVRQSYQRLLVIATLIQNRDFVLDSATPAQIKNGLQRADQTFGVRILLYAANGTVQEDTRIATAGVFPRIPLPTATQSQTRFQVRDAQAKVWVYAVRPLQEGGWVVVTVQAPGSAVLQLLRDDLFPPMVEAGLVALVAALILAFWVTRWVVGPLQHISKGASAVSSGNYQPIPLEGPSEVKELGQAFNDMAKRVQSSQRSQREFVANVSHELKTPLTSIQGFAQAILDGTANTPAALQQAGTIIFTEASRMSRLVLDLLDLARLDSGIADLERTPVDMATIIDNAVGKMTPQARQAQINLKFKLATIPQIIGDADRLSQVITNLIDNALKYTPAGGTVTVRADQVDGNIEVAISDTGAGISPEDLPHIFDRFFQTDKSRRGGSGHGVGLGLAIAREIVIAHNGSIEVVSSPGSGSTFVVKIPIARQEHASLLRKSN